MIYNGDYSFTNELTDSIKHELQSQLKEKLSEMIGMAIDDVMVEYVIVMIGNHKSMNQIRQDLIDFVGEEYAKEFVIWLYEILHENEKKSAKSKESMKKITSKEKQEEESSNKQEEGDDVKRNIEGVGSKRKKSNERINQEDKSNHEIIGEEEEKKINSNNKKRIITILPRGGEKQKKILPLIKPKPTTGSIIESNNIREPNNNNTNKLMSRVVSLKKIATTSSPSAPLTIKERKTKEDEPTDLRKLIEERREKKQDSIDLRTIINRKKEEEKLKNKQKNNIKRGEKEGLVVQRKKLMPKNPDNTENTTTGRRISLRSDNTKTIKSDTEEKLKLRKQRFGHSLTTENKEKSLSQDNNKASMTKRQKLNSRTERNVNNNLQKVNTTESKNDGESSASPPENFPYPYPQAMDPNALPFYPPYPPMMPIAPNMGYYGAMMKPGMHPYGMYNHRPKRQAHLLPRGISPSGQSSNKTWVNPNNTDGKESNEGVPTGKNSTNFDSVSEILQPNMGYSMGLTAMIPPFYPQFRNNAGYSLQRGCLPPVPRRMFQNKKWVRKADSDEIPSTVPSNQQDTSSLSETLPQTP